MRNTRYLCRLAVHVIVLGFCFPLVHAAKKSAAEASDYPAKPTVIDTYPALQWADNDWSTYILAAEYKGEAAFKFPVRHYKPQSDGFLFITATRIAWVPSPGEGQADQRFEISSEDATKDPSVRQVLAGSGFGLAKAERLDMGCGFKIAGKREDFSPLYQRGQEQSDSAKGSHGGFRTAVAEAFATWCTQATTDYQSAEQQFKTAVGYSIWANSPEMKAEQQAFQQQVAAWRAAGSKVSPPEEAQRHFVLAQEAYQEKDVGRQAEELAAALNIYPTWPDRQSDFAVLLGELNRYSEAIQHMQMYLELSPDAPDAQRAKQQIWIWQDKVDRTSAMSSQPAARPSSDTDSNKK